VDVADARLPHGILAHIGDYESGNEYHNLIQNKDYTAARLWLIINKYPVHKDDIQWKRGEPLFLVFMIVLLLIPTSSSTEMDN